MLKLLLILQKYYFIRLAMITILNTYAIKMHIVGSEYSHLKDENHHQPILCPLQDEQTTQWLPIYPVLYSTSLLYFMPAIFFLKIGLYFAVSRQDILPCSLCKITLA